MSNLHAPRGLSEKEAAAIARAWPDIEAKIVERERNGVPEPSIWTRPGEQMPELVEAKRQATIPESLCALQVGQARIVHSVRRPDGYMQLAERVEGAYRARRDRDRGKHAWIVERVA